MGCRQLHPGQVTEPWFIFIASLSLFPQYNWLFIQTFALVIVLSNPSSMEIISSSERLPRLLPAPFPFNKDASEEIKINKPGLLVFLKNLKISRVFLGRNIFYILLHIIYCFRKSRHMELKAVNFSCFVYAFLVATREFSETKTMEKAVVLNRN